MANSAVCRAVLRRHVNLVRQLRQRRAHSGKSEPSQPTDKSARTEDQIPTPNNIPTLPFWQRLGPLTRAAEAYGRSQRKRPLTTQLCSSLVIYFASDLSAQHMGGQDYDPVRTVRSLLIGGIASIPSFKWFVWLSHSFNYTSRFLSLATKVVVNQICFTPIFNSYFFGMQAALAGENLDAIWERIKETVPVSFVNSCKLWPAVTAFSFAFIPLEYRSLFAGFIAVGWQTYLSYLNRLAEAKVVAKIETEREACDESQICKPLSAGLSSKPLLIMASPYFRARQAFSTTIRPLVTPKRLPYIPRRHASTAPPSSSRLLTYTKTVGVALSLFAAYYIATDTRASTIHQYIIPRLIRLIYPDAEDAHHAGTAALKTLYAFGLHPRERPSPSASPSPDDSPLAVTVFNHRLTNPIGISAGLDKDAEIPDALFALGPAVVEVGGCTPLPQSGNPRPRVFRVPSLDGLINRYGLNSRGADAMAARLRDRLRKFARNLGLTEADMMDGRGPADVPPGSLQPGRLLLVQVAKNKNTDERDVEAVKNDYVRCVQRLAPYADVLVVNVSSPNTPGLRDLQATEPLTRILGAVVQEAQKTGRATKPRVMVKVSPDEDDDAQLEGVVQAVWMSGVDGVIVGNTTKRRDGLVPPGLRLSTKEQGTLFEEGGYSGPAMFERTLDLVGRYRKMLDSYTLQASAADGGESPSQKVVFATGGITNGEQALKVLNAGASVAMVYTAMVYGGSGTVTRMKDEMVKALTAKGV
ncbi:hypothetical protein QBC47DRAFT_422696 [Echria macrotheca]|uniref:Dihydroorotate dehydrogenase catalytic domain-containing protein n=1 Tax=Echria macrotheca TaxID=438768 RepID=A0AAJ0BBW0_9PEZI|nr:hypothetical protein QBC47DRAFT_422696 [Echria macrotheca]